MRGVDAARVHAQVVERVAFRNGADKEFVSDSMRQELSPSFVGADVEVPVAVAADRAVPDPARSGALDLRLKTLTDILRLRPGLHATEFTEFIGTQLLDQLTKAAPSSPNPKNADAA